MGGGVEAGTEWDDAVRAGGYRPQGGPVAFRCVTTQVGGSFLAWTYFGLQQKHFKMWFGKLRISKA